MYHKYKCRHCGKVEYYSERGARNFPNPFVKGCKKPRDGYHDWEHLADVNKLPSKRTI